MKLIAGLYAPVSGSISLGRSASGSPLRVSVVPQDIALFNDTIGFNIGLGKDGCTRDDIRKAAAAAHLNKLIDVSSEGIDTVVGNQGKRLSGGERQRLAIARALLSNPDIVLFDEATSSLDVLTESHIVADLMTAAKGKTVIIVAHRYSSIRHVDQVIVVEDGRITGTGRPDELARGDGWFAAMVRRNRDDVAAQT